MTSARVKLTLSYAGFLLLAGALLLATVWLFLLRYVPEQALIVPGSAAGTLTPGVFPVRSSLLHAFAPRAAAVLALLLAFGLVGGWFLAGRMLAPLTRITAAARLAGTGSLAHRIALTDRHDEFRELADAFDTMLAQLESHVAEQQRFAANASHELRTPLAITQALLESAPPGNPLLSRLHAVNARAIDLTEALLLLGRGDVTREPVDLSLIAEEAAETLLPAAEQRHITLTVTGGPAPTSGSAELLLRMASNLVQNAIVHNHPANGTVRIHTACDTTQSELRVENSGGHLPADLLPTLTEPFQRSTQRARTEAQPGAGLGLAIVQKIVAAHHGTLHLTAPPTGGLQVTVRLPARLNPPRRGPGG